MPPFSSDLVALNLVLFVAGFIVLIRGSDLFVDAAAKIAREFGIQEVVIGLTIVSIGTSLPELGTNAYASATGQSGISFGNVVGSNIANILLVLATGVILLGEIPIKHQLFKRDAIIMTLISFLLLAVSLMFSASATRTITRLEGGILLFLIVPYSVVLLRASGREEPDIIARQEERIHNAVLAMRLVVGLCMVFAGSKLIVDNVIWGANQLGVPEAIISATIIAFGTSVPELAVTITGVIKKENDIAAGNIIGSCIFNIVLVMGASSLIAPIEVGEEGIMLLTIMLVATVCVTVMMRIGWRLTRLDGILLLGGYLTLSDTTFPSPCADSPSLWKSTPAGFWKTRNPKSGNTASR